MVFIPKYWILNTLYFTYMRVFFSGIGGVGIGPLALIARDMGHSVLGSDTQASRYTELMASQGITVVIGQSAKAFTAVHRAQPIDWLVYTAALPPSHPELKAAKQLGIRTSKRDEFLNQLIKLKKLKLIAISGTHGKTTTTGMVIWLMKELGQPFSYAIGTNLSFGPSGQYAPHSQYFVYEADEYDRNFLQFSPFTSVIASVDYDHPDTYPDKSDYLDAFRQFILRSHCAYLWRSDAEAIGGLPPAAVHTFGPEEDLSAITLPGHNRRNAWLAVQSVLSLWPDRRLEELISIINRFPGTERRFEKLADNLYTDYAHHPVEISSTLELAAETSRDLVVVYQPHQNLRQREIMKTQGYKTAFARAKQVYWLPTYLSREPKGLTVLAPEELIAGLDQPDKFQTAKLNDELTAAVNQHLADGQTVLLMGAGDIDDWARRSLV